MSESDKSVQEIRRLKAENSALRSLLHQYQDALETAAVNFSDKTISGLLQDEQIRQIDSCTAHMMYVMDSTGVLIYISPAVEKLYGYRQSEVIGKLFTHFVHDSDQNHSYSVFRNRVLSGIPTINYVLFLKAANGSFVKSELNGSVYLNEDGTRGAVGYIKDITFRDKIQELFNFQQTLSELSLKNDMKEIISEALDEAEKLTESKAAFFHFIGEDQQSVSVQIYSANTQKQCKLKESEKHRDAGKAGLWTECLYKKVPVIHNEFENLRAGSRKPEGHVPLKRELLVPVLRNEKVMAIIGVGNKDTDYDQKDVALFSRLTNLVWDIIQKKKYESDLQASEKKFRNIIETAIEGIVMLDTESRITYANTRVQELLGYSKEEMEGRHIRFLFFDEDWVDHFRSDQFRHEGGSKIFERRYRCKDGSPCWAIISAVPVFEEGQFAGAFTMITDITSRKNAEKALQESQEQLLTLINSVPDIICFKDGEGKWLVANDFDLETFQLKDTDYKGKTDEELAEYSSFYREALLSCRQSDERAWRRKQMVRDEENIPSPDGTMRTFDLIKVPLFSPEGHRKNLIVIGRDITERIKGEEALHTNEERLRLTLQASGIVAWEIDTRDFSYREEGPVDEVFGRDRCSDLNDVLGHIHIDDRSRVLNIVEDAIKRTGEFNTEYRSISENGEVRWISATGRRVTNQYGKQKKLLGIARKTTDKEAAAEKLRISQEHFYKMFISHKAMMLLIDSASGRILNANPAAISFYGYSKEELLEKSIFDINPSPRDVVEKRLRDTHTLPANSYCTSHRIASGEVKDVEIHVLTQIQDDRNEFLLIVHDITDKNKMEQELIEAKENAEKSDRLKSEFLAQMSHEIRTPINNILSFSSLLKTDLQENLSPEQSDGFQIIENGGRRLIRTIDLILNMSDVQAGSYQLTVEQTDIHKDVLLSIFSEFRNELIPSDIDFSLECTASNTMVECDRYTVGQIFINLIENAFKFTPAGFIKLKVYESDAKLCVDVEDSGIGISDEYVQKIFTLFSQEESGYTRRFDGNGLGLALVKKYCALNGAEIAVRSEKGKGSTFSVSFNTIDQ